MEILIGAGLALITQIGKKYGIDQMYMITGISLLFGIIWYVAGPSTQATISEAWVEIAGSATIIYNAIMIVKKNA